MKWFYKELYSVCQIVDDSLLVQPPDFYLFVIINLFRSKSDVKLIKLYKTVRHCTWKLFINNVKNTTDILNRPERRSTFVGKHFMI